MFALRVVAWEEAGFLPAPMAALTPAARAEPTAAETADAIKLPFFGLAAEVLPEAPLAEVDAGRGAAFGLDRPADLFAVALAEAEALPRAGVALREDLADRFAAFCADFALPAVVLAEAGADLRAVLRAAGLAAPFFLACFFAFLAVRAGFFRAMTNPFGGFLDSFALSNVISIGYAESR